MRSIFGQIFRQFYKLTGMFEEHVFKIRRFSFKSNNCKSTHLLNDFAGGIFTGGNI